MTLIIPANNDVRKWGYLLTHAQSVSFKLSDPFPSYQTLAIRWGRSEDCYQIEG